MTGLVHVANRHQGSVMEASFFEKLAVHKLSVGGIKLRTFGMITDRLTCDEG